jgi:hypothetical protein
MGLDLLNFAFCVEEAFRVELAGPDTLCTPGRLIDYLHNRLPKAVAPICPTQRAFYRLRGALSQFANIPRNKIHPKSNLLDLVPARSKDDVWQKVGKDLGAEKYWPRLEKPGWFESPECPRMNIAGRIARFLVARNPWTLLRAGEGWSRPMVAAVVHCLIEDELGLRRGEYTEDSHWSHDMGLD